MAHSALHKNKSLDAEHKSSHPPKNVMPEVNSQKSKRIQTKLTVGKPNDVFEKEADAIADSVVNKPSQTFIQHKISSVDTHIQREESEPVKEEKDKEQKLKLQSTDPDFFAMRNPFFARNVLHLWDYSSAMGVWKYNYDFFNRLGFGAAWSGKAANITAPLFIDAQLKLNYPKWWEVTDRELNTTTYLAPLPAFTFDANFGSWKPLPFLQKKEAEPSTIDKPQTFLKPFVGDNITQGNNLQTTISHNKGKGAKLDDATRTFMEARIGANFKEVAIHNGSEATEMSKALQAKAFTVGSDVYFNEGAYQPETKEGQHLLAHELTHVVQQNPAIAFQQSSNAVVANKPHVPQVQLLSVTAESNSEKKGWYKPQYSYSYDIYDDLQWHVNFITSSYDLIVFVDEEMRKKLSPEQIGYAAAYVLEYGMSLSFKKGKETELPSYIAKVIRDYGLVHERFRVSVESLYFRSLFEPDEYEPFLQQLKDNGFNANNNYLIASGNFSTKEPQKKGKVDDKPKPAPAWLKAQKKELAKQIAEAKQHGETDVLPDNLVPWYSEKKNKWYLNVWVKLDKEGKEKAVTAIPMQEGEGATKLFEKVKQAASKTLLKIEDKARAEQAIKAPEWARNLEAQILQRLDYLRQKEKGATDLPDGVALLFKAENNKSADASVMLQVWVERGKTKIQRNYGSVPLTKYAKADDVVAYIRRMTPVLRQYENVPLSQLPADENIKVNFTDTSNFALAAFPSQIVPQDLRPDDVTVTGANNEFALQLDYEAVYGIGPLNDLYIASKLYNQYIHFYFELYKVSSDLKTPDNISDADWSAKWNWLYTTYNPDKNTNPPKNTQADAEAAKAKPAPVVPAPGPLVYKTNGSDSKSRIRFGADPGDYLIKAYTGHAAIGEHKLNRMSSVSWYPVRTRLLTDEGRSAVTRRSIKISNAEEAIKGFEKVLKENTSLTEKEKNLLAGSIAFKKEDLKRLRIAESGRLSASTQAELDFIERTLKQLAELKAAIPGYLARAKELDVAPSDLIEKQELLAIYWYVLTNNKTIDGYISELEAHQTNLRGVLKRSKEFESEFNPASPYVYNIETAFISTNTGLVYPLTMMIGEVSTEGSGKGYGALVPQVMYKLIDITHAETSKTYTGISFKTGAEGHQEAINHAFEDFGSEAVYGEGKIAVRFPAGAKGSSDPYHPGTEVKYFNSKEGILQKALKALALVAVVAGLAAIAATGVGAPAAALLFGSIAGVAGAITSIKNISDRSRRHKLEWDSEMALDIIGIIGVIPLAGSARLATIPKTVSNLQKFRVTQRLLQVYGWTEMGATVYLVPKKLAEDIRRIELDPDLTPDQKKKMIAQAQAGAYQTGIMMIGGALASKVGHHAQQSKGYIQESDIDAFNQQIDLIELEWAVKYQSMQDRKWIDAQGNWTDKAPEIVRQHQVAADVTLVDKPTPAIDKPKVKQPDIETPVKGGGEADQKPKTTTTKKTAEKPIGEKPETQVEPTKQEPEVKKKETQPEPQETTKAEEPKIKSPSPQTEPEIITPKDEPVIDKNIRDAEQAAQKAESERKHFEQEYKKAVEALKEASGLIKGKKGKAREEALELKNKAEAEKDFAEKMLEIARQDEVKAKYKSSGLRQEKLAAEYEKSRQPELPVEEAIKSREAQKAKNEERIKDKLSERDKLRAWLRNEDPGKKQSDMKETQERIAKLDADIDSIYKRQDVLNEELRQHRQRLASLQIESLKKLDQLEAEKRAAVGITPDHYQYLRKRSPNSKLRKKFAQAKIDAVYEVPIQGTPHPDHIVSMNEISQMEGFSRLSPKHQLQVLNLEANFMALDGRVNSSKGDRSFSEWKGHPEFGEIPTKKRALLLDLEAKAKDAIKKEIFKLDPINKK